MYSKDIKTIYALLDVHAKVNGIKDKKSKNEENQKECYIDNIIF